MASFRKGLDRIILIGGWIGACFVALIAAIIVVQIVCRELGYQVRGADDFTAWSVAASIFFALAYTFKKGGHIQVTLIIDRLRGPQRPGGESCQPLRRHDGDGDAGSVRGQPRLRQLPIRRGRPGAAQRAHVDPADRAALWGPCLLFLAAPGLLSGGPLHIGKIGR